MMISANDVDVGRKRQASQSLPSSSTITHLYTASEQQHEWPWPGDNVTVLKKFDDVIDVNRLLSSKQQENQMVLLYGDDDAKRKEVTHPRFFLFQFLKKLVKQPPNVDQPPPNSITLSMVMLKQIDEQLSMHDVFDLASDNHVECNNDGGRIVLDNAEERDVKEVLSDVRKQRR